MNLDVHFEVDFEVGKRKLQINLSFFSETSA